MEASTRVQRGLGHGQFAAGGVDASTLLSTITVGGVVGIPAGAVGCQLQCSAQAIRWRDDGTAPTAAIGFPLAVGTPLTFEGNLAQLRLISQVAGAVVDVRFFGG